MHVDARGRQGVERPKADHALTSRPFVHVAEQVPVNGLQVGKIKAALKGCFGELAGPLRYEVRFGCFKQRLVRDTEAVFKNAGFRLNVMVVAGVFGHASDGRGCCG